MIDQGDYADILGLSLIKFDTLKEKLDPLNSEENSIFKGFSPRWTLPTRLISETNNQKNTSCILLMIDSAREVDLGLIDEFSQEILGRNEMLLSESAA